MNRTIQWLNSNRYRRYPVIEDVALRYVSGNGDAIELPDDFLLDCQCAAYSAAGPLQLSVVALHLVAGQRELRLAFQLDGWLLGIVVVPDSMVAPYAATLRTAAATLSVVLGPGVAAVIAALGAYQYGTEFIWTGHGRPGGQFEPALLSTQTRHRVASLLGDAAGSVPISGKVYWEEGYCVSLSLDRAESSIRIHALPGAGKGYSCAPVAPGAFGGLFSINGIYGDALGRIGLVGGLGFSIIPEPDLHRITIQPSVAKADIDCGTNE